MEEIVTMRDMTTLTRRLTMGMLAAVLTGIWVILIVTIDPHAQLLFVTMPSLAVMLGMGFVGLAFVIGRSDP